MPTPLSPTETRHLYRTFYKHLLRAVQYSIPARYLVRDQLRQVFRYPHSRGYQGTQPLLPYDSQRVANTLEFLKGAAEFKGPEHRLMKKLLFVAWHRKKLAQFETEKKMGALESHLSKTAYVQYDMTVAMLNDSMGLCLR